ncbi:hypothetical protein PTTG_27006 [Puccinia triticina 1-1 BBBD Race 1]|uniref:Uncharacterized protein n=1 Tax=Puccinia triticina (isolate 1-1 / race 1 (BBBD)) TaxID=630390 RepID=A0A180GNX2_PUCT1|nr:hypothetical protein PTTG_27006 [Puccinia triticina 1-1 BBBD Race 1]
MRDEIKIYTQRCPTCRKVPTPASPTANNPPRSRSEWCERIKPEQKPSLHPQGARNLNLGPASSCFPSNQTAADHKERIARMEKALLALSATPSPWSALPPLKAFGSFQYLLDWGLEPLALGRQLQKLLHPQILYVALSFVGLSMFPTHSSVTHSNPELKAILSLPLRGTIHQLFSQPKRLLILSSHGTGFLNILTGAISAICSSTSNPPWHRSLSTANSPTMVLPPSTFAASSSTPSTGTCNRKKAILEPVCPHHRLPFAFAARLYLSRANQPWDGTLDCLLAALACAAYAAYAINLPGIARFVLLFIPSVVFRFLTQLTSNLSKQALSAARALPAINSIPEHALPTSLKLIQSKQDLSALLNILIGAIYPICFAAPLSCLLTALVSSAACQLARTSGPLILRLIPRPLFLIQRAVDPFRLKGSPNIFNTLNALAAYLLACPIELAQDQHHHLHQQDCQPPPQADPNSEDEEYLRALDEAWEAFEAELDLKYGTGPYQININSQYQESLKDEMTDSASPATPTPASTS